MKRQGGFLAAPILLAMWVAAVFTGGITQQVVRNEAQKASAKELERIHAQVVADKVHLTLGKAVRP